ncbi:MAG: HAMP domain-containing protein [Cyanobacteria bacterium Co-bin13]|nr:HAMP domain-containing protein [Cyanobacteria bacterium Co-bin13]
MRLQPPAFSRHRPSKWRRGLSGLRLRILTGYLLLMALSTLAVVIGTRQTLLGRLNERIDQSLSQEVQEFQQLVDGRDPKTGAPFGDNIEAIFAVFLRRNIPADGEFLLTLLNGEFYRSSPTAVPDALDPDGGLVQSLALLTHPQRGQVTSSNGEIIVYQAEPVVRGQNRGVFVVTYLVSRGQTEINQATRVIVKVTLAVLAVTSVLAWIAAGRALAPLRLLTETVRTLRESDLTQRIPVQGASEISELTLRFNEMLDRLQAAFASQRAFTSDAGHELRTPITIIRGHLELLGDDPQEKQETLAIVLDELDRMSRFVDDLLLLAKLEHQSFLRLDPIDLEAFTEELFAKAKALSNHPWQLEALGQGRLVADRQRLTQAIMNLAQNAAQHSDVSSPILLGSGLVRGYARFWVRDTGEGIPLEHQEQIFERFARISHRYRRSEGAGLGLAIVKTIAEAHGGRVELISQPGYGSTFTVVIPVDEV